MEEAALDGIQVMGVIGAGTVDTISANLVDLSKLLWKFKRPFFNVILDRAQRTFYSSLALPLLIKIFPCSLLLILKYRCQLTLLLFSCIISFHLEALQRSHE